MIEDDIIGICNAYEQGYGHGYQLRTLPNPYSLEKDVRIAWDYGYAKGKGKRIDQEKEILDDSYRNLYPRVG